MGEHPDRAWQQPRAGARRKTVEPYKRVALLGFMGAGKTTVGRLLAPVLGWRFVDTDAMLVEHHGTSIAKLFADFGEEQFRVWEAEAVAETLAGNMLVAALGGGAIEHPATRARLARDPAMLTVYLEAPLAVSIERCRAEPGAAARPVLEARAALEQRFARRLPWYERAALTLATQNKTPPELAEAIASAVRRAP